MDNSTQPNQEFARFQPTSRPESNFGEELKTSSEPQSMIATNGDGNATLKNKPSKIIVVTLAGLLLMIGVFAVGGYYFEQKTTSQEILDPGRPPVGTTVSPTVGIVRPTSTTELNIDMLTYSNQDYGYQVSYPKSWFLITENVTMEDIMIGTKSEVYFLVSDDIQPLNEPFLKGIVIEASLCDRSPECKSQELYIDSLIPYTDAMDNDGYRRSQFTKQYRIEKITIAGSPALRIDNLSNTGLTLKRSVVILGPTNLIKIWTPIVDSSEPDYAVFDQMLSTFRFTDNSSVTVGQNIDSINVIPTEYSSCISDTDCVLVPRNCFKCNCESSVNADYKDVYLELLTRSCPKDDDKFAMMCEWCCNNKAVCQNNLCVAEDLHDIGPCQ